MAAVDVTVYYLEMLAPNARSAPAPRAGLSVSRAHQPSVAFYRELYNAVGKDYHWHSRGKMSDAELAAIISDPLDEVHVLHVDGAAAGFGELDRRRPNEIELVQFGLKPDYIGRGLGKWFLQWVIDKAWNYKPQRFWLHTCTLDHPQALPNYLKAGFREYKRQIIQRQI